MKGQIFQFVPYQNGSARLMARLVGLDSQALVQADVQSIAWQTWAKADESVETGSGTLTIANVIFDNLQSESWSADQTGYNFRWDAPPGTFPAARVERLSILATLANGIDVVPLELEGDVLRTSAG